MPFTINSQPQTINSISQGSVFEITMTGIEDATNTRYLRWQIFDVDDNAITELESVQPKEGEKFVLDLTDDVKQELSTQPPRERTSVIKTRDEPEMSVQYVVKFHEYTFNKLTCTGSESGEVVTNTKTMINLVNQFFGFLDIANNGYFSMSLTPEYVFVDKGSCDFHYLYALQTTAIKLITYRKFSGSLSSSAGIGSEYHQDTFAVLAGSTSIQIDPKIQGPLAFNQPEGEDGFIIQPFTEEEAIDSITAIELYIGNVLKATYIFDDCLCDDGIIAYQSYLGGWRIMHGFSVEEVSSNRSFTEICTYQGVDSPNSTDIRTKGGKRISNKESFRTITLTKILKEEEQYDLLAYEDFLNSGKYLIDIVDFQGPTLDPKNAWVGFIPTSGSVRYYDKEQVHTLVVTGRINQSFKLPQ